MVSVRSSQIVVVVLFVINKLGKHAKVLLNVNGMYKTFLFDILGIVEERHNKATLS